jgi:hypothetical protein
LRAREELKFGIDCGKLSLSLAANSLAVKIYEVPHVSHKRLLFVWRQQPDELIPLIACHHGNVPTRHLCCCPIFLSRGSLGRFIV